MAMTGRPIGKVRSPVLVIVFSIITVGIYALYWHYQVFEDNKRYAGDGLGGVAALIISIIPLVNIAILFLLPSEVGNIYTREGRDRPVQGITGFWNLIPLVGTIIWIVKCQSAINRLWQAHGAPAG